MKIPKIVAVLALACVLPLTLSLGACTTTNPHTGKTELTKTSKGALIGAAGGAIIGGIADGGKGAAIGAGVGAATGAIIGHTQEKH